MKFHKFNHYNPNLRPLKKVYRLIFVKLFNNLNVQTALIFYATVCHFDRREKSP